MKKSVFALVFAFFMLNSVLALGVEVEEASGVIVKEIGNPAIFNFTITSPQEDNIEIFNFLGFTISPRGNFDVAAGKNNLEVKFYPSKAILENTGYYTFEYNIRGNFGVREEILRVKLVNLDDRIVTLSTDSVSPKDEVAVFHISNKENVAIENLLVSYNSVLFSGEKVISLKPFEEQNFTVPINKDIKRGLRAGEYQITNTLKVGTANEVIKTNLRYNEAEDISTKTEGSGLIVRKNTITKTNLGNVDTKVSIEIDKDILSRLFTYLSVDAQSTSRYGLGVKYSWEKTLAPGESYSVTSTTNYTFPFVVLLLVVVVGVLVKLSQNNKVIVKKNVSFVKTKGDEFALKVTLYVKANKQADNLQLIDPLPPSLKLYENYGKKPDKIDVSSRRMTWNIGSLSAGEERVFSYIAYSKVRVVGRFELPSSLAIFSHDGKTEEVSSNRAFFVSQMVSAGG